MLTFNHRIGEQFTLITPSVSAESVRIFRATDGRYFNKLNNSFEVITSEEQREALSTLSLTNHPSGTPLKSLAVTFLPRVQLDLVMEYRDSQGNTLYYERHVFGGYAELSRPNLCVIFGTLYDPSGNPIVGARVDASLNKSGYYIDKHPIIGPAVSVVTDERGYFELALMQGINVTISIASTGFNTRGYVPKKPAVELSGYCLLTGES